ncbi:MAG TPA: carotenoid oxygenase family protein [Paucimonas sp.]|nr:carotenoid oxygenase family protein [Paucimonas sp.]
MTLDAKRRACLRALACAGLAWPLAGRAASAEQAWASSFAPYAGPLNARFPGVIEADAPRIEGRLPAALRGTLYRNGPARMRLGDTAYAHWFDGDGMVQAFRLADGKASHRGVLLRTPKLAEEEAAGRFLYPGFGTRFADGAPVRNPDAINVANINLLPLRGGRELYALWEGGSALRIDPDTLAAQGFKAWSPETAGAPFSAHPRVAPDGTVWNFGYLAGSGKLIVYEIAPDGRLRRQALLDAPQADMVHDFAVTERYLVFLLMPLAFERTMAATMLDGYRWHADAPLIALAVDKRDWSLRRFELPNGGVFHLGNAWEEGGTVRLAYVRQADILREMRDMRIGNGTPADARAASDWTEVELDLAAGRARQHSLDLEDVEFPCFDARRTGLKSTVALLLQRSAAMPRAVPGMDTVLALRDGRVERYAYGSEWIAEEHLLVPRPGGRRETDAWIVGTAYNWKEERTTLSVFECDALAHGPVARVHLPYGLPLGLHGQFVAG